MGVHEIEIAVPVDVHEQGRAVFSDRQRDFEISLGVLRIERVGRVADRRKHAFNDDGWASATIIVVAGLRFVVHEGAVLKDGGRYHIHYIHTAMPSLMGVFSASMILSMEEST